MPRNKHEVVDYPVFLGAWTPDIGLDFDGLMRSAGLYTHFTKHVGEAPEFLLTTLKSAGRVADEKRGLLQRLMSRYKPYVQVEDVPDGPFCAFVRPPGAGVALAVGATGALVQVERYPYLDDGVGSFSVAKRLVGQIAELTQWSALGGNSGRPLARQSDFDAALREFQQSAVPRVNGLLLEAMEVLKSGVDTKEAVRALGERADAQWPSPIWAAVRELDLNDDAFVGWLERKLRAGPPPWAEFVWLGLDEHGKEGEFTVRLTAELIAMRANASAWPREPAKTVVQPLHDIHELLKDERAETFLAWIAFVVLWTACAARTACLKVGVRDLGGRVVATGFSCGEGYLVGKLTNDGWTSEEAGWVL